MAWLVTLVTSRLSLLTVAKNSILTQQWIKVVTPTWIPIKIQKILIQFHQDAKLIQIFNLRRQYYKTGCFNAFVKQREHLHWSWPRAFFVAHKEQKRDQLTDLLEVISFVFLQRYLCEQKINCERFTWKKFKVVKILLRLHFSYFLQTFVL